MNLSQRTLGAAVLATGLAGLYFSFSEQDAALENNNVATSPRNIDDRSSIAVDIFNNPALELLQKRHAPFAALSNEEVQFKETAAILKTYLEGQVPESEMARMERVLFSYFKPIAATSDLRDADIIFFGETHTNDNRFVYADILRTLEVSQSLILLEVDSDRKVTDLEIFPEIEERPLSQDVFQRLEDVTIDIEETIRRVEVIEQRKRFFVDQPLDYYGLRLGLDSIDDAVKIVPADCSRELKDQNLLHIVENQLLQHAYILFQKGVPLHPLHTFILQRKGVSEDRSEILAAIRNEKSEGERLEIARQFEIQENIIAGIKEGRNEGRRVLVIFGDNHLDGNISPNIINSSLAEEKFVYLSMYRVPTISPPTEKVNSTSSKKVDEDVLSSLFIKHMDSGLIPSYATLVGYKGDMNPTAYFFNMK